MKVTTQTYSPSQLSEWPESDPTTDVHATFDAVESSSGHLKHDYLIKYAYFDKYVHFKAIKKVLKNSPCMGVDIIQELVNKGKRVT